MVFLTGANGVVIVDHADGIDAARARTRILTGVPDASLTNRTISAQDTFWSARDARIADIILLTRARWLVVDDDTLSIGSTRIWIARILGKRRWQVAFGFGFTEEERVSGVARGTVTDGVVFLHVAVCVEAA